MVNVQEEGNMSIETCNSIKLNCEVVMTSTALLISAAVAAAGAVGTAHVTRETAKKAEKGAEKRSQEAMRLQEALASQATAPITTQESNVELQSVEAKEDEAIRSRSARSRLRVERGGSGGVGTGLSVG